MEQSTHKIFTFSAMIHRLQFPARQSTPTWRLSRQLRRESVLHFQLPVSRNQTHDSKCLPRKPPPPLRRTSLWAPPSVMVRLIMLSLPNHCQLQTMGGVIATLNNQCSDNDLQASLSLALLASSPLSTTPSFTSPISGSFHRHGRISWHFFENGTYFYVCATMNEFRELTS